MTLDPNILVALGVPGLVLAIGGAISAISKAWGAAKVKSADAALTTANAKRLDAEAAKIQAEVAREREETTGRFAKVAEETIAATRADLSECEKVREELRIEIDGERRARITLAAECEKRERSAEKNIAELRQRIEEIERRSVRPAEV